MLELPYDAGFMSHWKDYRHITGDTKDSRGGAQVIQALPRRAIDPDLQRRFEGNPDFRLAVELLGYG